MRHTLYKQYFILFDIFLHGSMHIHVFFNFLTKPPAGQIQPGVTVCCIHSKCLLQGHIPNTHLLSPWHTCFADTRCCLLAQAVASTSSGDAVQPLHLNSGMTRTQVQLGPTS